MPTILTAVAHGQTSDEAQLNQFIGPINTLETQMAGKAATSHTHAASDIATGTAMSGYVPISDGAGNAVWGAVTVGASGSLIFLGRSDTAQTVANEADLKWPVSYRNGCAITAAGVITIFDEGYCAIRCNLHYTTPNTSAAVNVILEDWTTGVAVRLGVGREIVGSAEKFTSIEWHGLLPANAQILCKSVTAEACTLPGNDLQTFLSILRLG